MRTAQSDVVFLVEATLTKTSAKFHEIEIRCLKKGNSNTWMMFSNVLFCSVAAVLVVSPNEACSVFALGT